MSKIHENYTKQLRILVYPRQKQSICCPRCPTQWLTLRFSSVNVFVALSTRITGLISSPPPRVKISPPPSARYRIKTRFYRVAIRCRCFVHSSKLDREYLCNYKRIEIKKKNKKTKKEKRRNEGESGHSREQISSIGRFTQKPGIFMQQRRYGEWKNRLDGILFCYEAGPTYLFRTANRFKLATRVPLEPIFPCPPFAL